MVKVLNDQHQNKTEPKNLTSSLKGRIMPLRPDSKSLRAAAAAVDVSTEADAAALKKAAEARDAQADADNKSADADRALSDITPNGAGGNQPPQSPTSNSQSSDKGNRGGNIAIWAISATLLVIALVVWLAMLTATKANNGDLTAVKQAAGTAQVTADQAKAEAKEATRTAQKAASDASEAKADAANAILVAGDAKATAEKCGVCAKKTAKPAVAKKPQAAKAVCKENCVPREQPKKISETPRGDGRCFVKAQSGTFKYNFELRHETSTGKLMIALVDGNEKVAEGTKVHYLNNEMSVTNEKGVNCDGNQAKLYTNLAWAKQQFGLPSSCDIVRKP